MNQSKLTQIERYGGPEGYSAEMKRRQSLRKTHGTGGWRWMKQHDPKRFAKIMKERDARRHARKTIQGSEG